MGLFAALSGSTLDRDVDQIGFRNAERRRAAAWSKGLKKGRLGEGARPIARSSNSNKLMTA